MNVTASASPRPYQLGRRADGVRRTTEAIVRAALSFVPGRPWDQVTIAEVAARAGVTERTVLRHFATKDDLARACVAQEQEDVRAERPGVPGTSLADAIAELVAHYEERGDLALWLLDQARRSEVLAQAAAEGSALHDDWARRVFAAPLAALGLPAAERRRRLAALCAATDVHAWDVLRRRRGLSRRDTEAALRALCSGLLRVDGEAA